MSKASLSNGTGPGSSISLAPETVRIRDALIEKFSGAPLEDMTNFMTMALSNESDELRRLGILAARIYLLRHRVANLIEFNRNPALTSLPRLDTSTLSLNLTTAHDPSMTDDMDAKIEPDQWSRIQMTEPGEVNGVRFLAGTVIDAQTQDAEKLIRSGKAARVDEDGKIIDHHDNDFTASDADDGASEAPDNETSASRESDDDVKADAPNEVSGPDAKTEADPTQQSDADEAPKEPTS